MCSVEVKTDYWVIVFFFFQAIFPCGDEGPPVTRRAAHVRPLPPAIQQVRRRAQG